MSKHLRAYVEAQNVTIYFRMTPAVGSYQPAVWHGDHGVDSVVVRDGQDPFDALAEAYPGRPVGEIITDRGRSFASALTRTAE